MNIRPFAIADEQALWALFRQSVHQVNKADYTPAQLLAWAPDDDNPQWFYQRIRDIKPYVLEMIGEIVAYADLQPDGVIDQFFCHPDWVGQGLGQRLFAYLQERASERGLTRLSADVSITARPFFERLGFVVLEEQEVELRGQRLINFKMQRVL